jgi:hypothetical protein
VPASHGIGQGLVQRPSRTEGPEAPVCNACRTVPLSYLSLDLDEPVSGWTAFFESKGIEIAEDDLGRASIARHLLARLIAEQREREARLLEEAAAQQAPVVTPHEILARKDMSAYEVMMSVDGTSPQQEFGTRPPPRFLEEALEAGARHQAAEQEAVKRRKEAQ